MYKSADCINSRVSPPSGQWYGPGAGGRGGSWRRSRGCRAEPQRGRLRGDSADVLRRSALDYCFCCWTQEIRSRFGLFPPPDLSAARAGWTRRRKRRRRVRRRRKAGAARAWDCGFKSPVRLFRASRTGRSERGLDRGVLRVRVAEVGTAVMWVVEGLSVSGCLGGGEGRLTSPRITGPNTSALSFRRVNPRSVPFLPPRFCPQWSVMGGRVGAASSGGGCSHPRGVGGRPSPGCSARRTDSLCGFSFPSIFNRFPQRGR